MSLQTVEIASDIIGVLLGLLLIVCVVPLIENGRDSMMAALFIFAVLSFILSEAYWLVYNALRPDTRMPIAANEIGEAAWFLLLATILVTNFRERKIPARTEVVVTMIFAAASIALWIAWTGEWIQDILGGIPFGYFLCACARSVKQTDALKRNEWIALGVSLFSVVLGQTSYFFASEDIQTYLDYICYAVMFSIVIWMFVKTIHVIRRNEDTKAGLAISFLFSGISFTALYMSAGWYYQFALALCYAAMVLMFISLRREVTT